MVLNKDMIYWFLLRTYHAHSFNVQTEGFEVVLKIGYPFIIYQKNVTLLDQKGTLCPPYHLLLYIVQFVPLSRIMYLSTIEVALNLNF